MHSTLSRRSAQAEATRQVRQKLISFTLGKESYAFPIHHVQRILDEFQTHGDTGQGISLTRVDGETLTIWDLQCLFTQVVRESIPKFLMICQAQRDQSIGIPLEQLPSVIEVTQSQIQPLPALYRALDLPEAVTGVVCLAQDRELFFLDLAKALVPKIAQVKGCVEN
jgi:chemotaxis signal transduction protein